MTTPTKNPEPKSIKETIKHKYLVEAMNDELESDDTWKITTHKNFIRCKWLYKTKYKPNGRKERDKSRFVVLGNKQTYSVD